MKQVIVIFLIIITSLSLIGCSTSQNLAIEKRVINEKKISDLTMEADDTQERIAELKNNLQSLSELMDERKRMLEDILKEIQSTQGTKTQELDY